jgi:predicted CxxxxCH...CXXCH cytochrome family protein
MKRTTWGAALLIGTASLISGCENEREPLGKASCPSWRRNVQSLLADRCVECHGPEQADGNYRLDEYLEAFGTGTNNTPNIRARSPDSAILTIFDADDIHRDLAPGTEPVLDRWVVECAAQFGNTNIHEPGILNPFSPEFHGEQLRTSGWDFDACAECHGEDFEGQAAAGSCNVDGCHAQPEAGEFPWLPGERVAGPKDCSVCHGDLLELDAHEIHTIGGMLEKQYDCEVCHIVPQAFEDPGHVFLEDGEVDPPPADVIFDGPALIPDGPDPEYVEAEQTCSNTYCHAITGMQTNAELPAPAWTDEGPLACTSCHGGPPSAEHPQSADCENCHVAVAAGPEVLVSTELHLNREVNFAETETECATCHGSMENSAPPVDLDDRSDPTFLAVGAHQNHLNPRFNLAAPVACTECHAVPNLVSEPGHIDSARPAEVFPDVEGVGDLASADGATPSYDFEAGTCSNNYCHGNGDSLSEDQWPGKVDVLNWDAPFTGVFCGSCHGVPPTIFPHQPTMGLARCTECHNATVDANGRILFEEVDGMRTSRHINGEIDVVFPE